MNPEIQKRLLNLSSRKVALISLISFILLMLAIAAQFTYAIVVYDKIYNGVFIEDINAGGMSMSDLADRLQKDYQDKIAGTELTLKVKDISKKILYSEIGVKYDIEAAVNKANEVGRTGNIATRIKEIIITEREGKKLSLEVSYDEKKVENIVESLHSRTLIRVKEADLLIQDDKVTIHSGRYGENIDKASVLSEIETDIKLSKGGVRDIPLIKTPPSKINVDEYYRQINCDAKDASVKVEDNKLIMIPPVTGRSIDKGVLSSIAAELENTENIEKILPVIFTSPKLTVDDVTAKLFKDTLATMNTQFYTSNQNDANRGENIRIASSKINGKIFAPGEVFSFNDVVGPRTEDEGYKIAHAYSGGRIIDDVGGGICQVSTTLYNAVLFADLDVNERINHMFTVGYVPKGRDAAVSYGSADFKFRNSTNWPIKIESWVTNDNKIYFAIRGTSETPGKTVEINPQIVKTLDFITKYVDDPTLPEGENVVKTEGMTGFIVDTYRIVKQDGKVIEEAKLHTSIYNPLHKEVIRGTKKP